MYSKLQKLQTVPYLFLWNFTTIRRSYAQRISKVSLCHTKKIIAIPKQQKNVIRDTETKNMFIRGPCCVFQPAFGSCAHPKAGQNTFFSCF